MSTAKILGWIAGGYAVAVGAGFAAVAVTLHGRRRRAGLAGMVAFGDMMLFVLAAGIVGLIPTLFSLKLFVEKAPRTLIVIELLLAVLGLTSWLAMTSLASGTNPREPAAIGQMLGLFIAFIAIPRIVFGPVLLVIEGLTFLLVPLRAPRTLLALAALMDVIPLGLHTLHMARAPHY